MVGLAVAIGHGQAELGFGFGDSGLLGAAIGTAVQSHLRQVNRIVSQCRYAQGPKWLQFKADSAETSDPVRPCSS